MELAGSVPDGAPPAFAEADKSRAAVEMVTLVPPGVSWKLACCGLKFCVARLATLCPSTSSARWFA